jgi:hypothetical protein
VPNREAFGDPKSFRKIYDWLDVPAFSDKFILVTAKCHAVNCNRDGEGLDQGPDAWIFDAGITGVHLVPTTRSQILSCVTFIRDARAPASGHSTHFKPQHWLLCYMSFY